MNDDDPEARPASIPPELAATYREGDRYGFLEAAGGRLRFACWNAPGRPAGSVVLQSGRAEFIEKYATEIVGELLGRGYSVFAMDWRGQGLSDRPLPDRGKGHIDSFATYIADFQLFLEQVVLPAAPPPVLALCHSMGAHIVLRWLSENGSGPFAAGVLTAPMTGLRREAMLRSVLMVMPEMAAVEERYLFGTGPFIALAREFDANFVTHDERRYRFTEDWFAADPRLMLGGPTLGWARQAARSMTAALAPGYLERIELPLMLISAGEDPLVASRTHGPVAARLPHGEHVTIAGAKHEVMMETDDLRARFWEAFDRMAIRVTGRVTGGASGR
ncbi:alpha/beta fold hydrolase [Reyranella sp.]|uniref:alpha/beta fold hydrolase n=1 Tax=Reyranella sp. TaxID=1929291 RepID=UPI003BAB0454